MVKLKFIIECDHPGCDSFINIKTSIKDVISLEYDYYTGEELELKTQYPIQELAKEGWVSTIINYSEQVFCPKCVPIYHLKS